MAATALLGGCSASRLAGELISPTRPTVSGEAVVAGLAAPVTIRRDEHGVAYVHAGSLEDLVFAQGFAMAEDRLFQMDLARRLASGRISELAGDVALELDRRNRTLGFRRLAERQLAALDAAPRARLEAFARGVNAYVERFPDEVPVDFALAGLEVEPWTPVDTLAIVASMAMSLSADLKQTLLLHRIAAAVGPERAAELAPLNAFRGFPRTPLVGIDLARHPALGPLVADLEGRAHAPALELGSNNWVVAATRSASGHPIVANDPHLAAASAPGPLYPVVLDAPGVHAAGVTIPGAPGIVIGRNETLAWGMTNNYADVQDLYLETLDGDGERYLSGDAWRPLERIEEVILVRDADAVGGLRPERLVIRSTERGPLVSTALGGDGSEALSLRWALAEEVGARLGLDELWLAHTPDELLETAATVALAPLNLVWAHRDGDFGWHVVGRIPIRHGHDGSRVVPGASAGEDWRGWMPFEALPAERTPGRGWTGSANHRVVGPEFPWPYSSYFAPPFRFQRMRQLLDPPSASTPEDHVAFQTDTLNLLAVEVTPTLVRAIADEPGLTRLAQVLAGWDGHSDAGSAGAAAFHVTWAHLLEDTFVDELGPTLTADYLDLPYAWQERFLALLGQPEAPWFDDLTTVGREDRDTLIRRAAREALADLDARFGDDAATWTWGALHQLELVNPLGREGFKKRLFGAGSHPMAGDGETLQRARYDLSKGFGVTFNAGLRMVADLGDDCRLRATVPAGVSGRWTSPHFADQTPAYLAGESVSLWLCPEELDHHTRATLTLTPDASRTPTLD